jgi:hypothetical protein
MEGEDEGDEEDEFEEYTIRELVEMCGNYKDCKGCPGYHSCIGIDVDEL